MENDSYYRNRILWRSSQHELDEFLFENLVISDEIAHKIILDKIKNKGCPLLVFFKDINNWTVITDMYVLGICADIYSEINLDDISKIVKPYNIQNVTPENRNENEFIEVGDTRLVFWTPPGKAHFGILSILRMFPLGSGYH